MAAETILPLRMSLGQRLLLSRLMALNAALLHGDRPVGRSPGNHGIAVFGRGKERHADHHGKGKHDEEPIDFSQLHAPDAFVCASAASYASFNI